MTGKPDKIQFMERLTQSQHSPIRQRLGGGFKRDGFTFRFYHIAIIGQTERGKSR